MAAQREARRYRTLLYASAVLMLGGLVLTGLYPPRGGLLGHALDEIARGVGAGHAYRLLATGEQHRWSAAGEAWPEGWPKGALAFAAQRPATSEGIVPADPTAPPWRPDDLTRRPCTRPMACGAMSGMGCRTGRLTPLVSQLSWLEIRLAELAALVGLSQAHFARAFKASTGLPPYRWQLECRIRQAQALLSPGDVSREEVAQVSGFAEAVHVGRRFRQIVGIAPATWRRTRRPPPRHCRRRRNLRTQHRA
jgi:AraC-like DNA-binding protein